MKIVPMADESGVSAVSVTDEIKTKLPQPKKPHTLFYTTDDDRLVRGGPQPEGTRIQSGGETRRRTCPQIRLEPNHTRTTERKLCPKKFNNLKTRLRSRNDGE